MQAKCDIRKAFEEIREYCMDSKLCAGCPLNHGGVKTCDQMPCDWSFNDEVIEV